MTDETFRHTEVERNNALPVLTVELLIQHLKDYPPDAEVNVVIRGADISISITSLANVQSTETKQEIVILIIEPDQVRAALQKLENNNV